ncbi:uncharacterized protein N7479_005649 [Penicillium vulpinum]|uniref:Zn(2)-C6 fungal-type domain-containing protein n=1 Tax=Penicillium vulpinum TaxID=29845 RepID=A0A1V6SFA1_9EURO|nr:uncharacterized protein N7479_005649 [Penicillium vulpinum]KAJ5958499.1 hypothetical protein N7479_005649 [Penicillium vulpinum]OQE12598.1 hypothetical protein PENVUL_c001G07979 [Penicillium vulpinum]
MVATLPLDEASSETRSRAIKHVTRACSSCQKRKTKCDGLKPQCSVCVLYKRDCTYSQQIDKRRMASKGKISTLVAYVQDLESLLRRHNLEFPPGRPANFLPPLPTSSPSAVDAEPDTSEPLHGVADDTASIIKQSIFTVSNDSPEDTQEHLSISEEPSNHDNHLSDRMGSLQIAEDGQLRLFGPTSNLHISHVGPFPLFNSNIRLIHWNEALILTAAGVNSHVDQELEDHLTKLYFAWENPNIPLVDERAYYQGKTCYRNLNQPNHRYSEVLNNAICAVGATLTSRYCPDLPESLVDFFATRSKALLEVEMDSPTLSTVQSLGILSGVEALLTRDARGWLYSGMAMRLATDLGLHIDAAPFAERGLIDLEEARLRSSTFWGTYAHERMWSLYVGRPESIDHLDITVQLPFRCGSQPDMNDIWRPYIDENQQANNWESPSLLHEVAHGTVTICTKMASIRKVLQVKRHANFYSIPRGTKPDMKKLYAFAAKARDELDLWLSGLSENLSVDMINIGRIHLPHVLQLHMQFHAVRIIVDQPFAFQQPGPGGLTEENITHSRECCHDAALSITKLLQAIRRHFTLRRVNIQTVHLIFTAMLVHTQSAFLSPDFQIRDTARRQLEICSQALGEIGQAYKNALRALEVITSIKSELLRQEKREFMSGLGVVGQSSSISSMIALGQIPSGLFGVEPGVQQSWMDNFMNDSLFNRDGSAADIDLDQCASMGDQISLSGHSSWASCVDSSAPLSRQ